jgi:hypothetical protein
MVSLQAVRSATFIGAWPREPVKDFDREEALGITRGIVHLFKKTKISPLLARLQNHPPTDEEVALLAAEVQRGRVADLTMPDRRAKRRQ